MHEVPLLKSHKGWKFGVQRKWIDTVKLILISLYLLGVCRIFMVVSADLRSRAKEIKRKSEVAPELERPVAEPDPVIRPPRSSWQPAQPENLGAVLRD